MVKESNRKPEARSRNTGRLVGRVLAVAITLAGVAGLVQAIKWLGDSARRGIGTRDRYEMRFADISCEPPPGVERAAFLTQVRYQSKFAQTFQSIDPDLEAKLTRAFASHPWVAEVEKIEVEPDGPVRVRLKYRVPALAVRVAGGSRVVDRTGILLPLGTDASGLPLLIAPVAPPAIDSGKKWDDATVLRALELAEAHHPATLEKSKDGWRLTMADGRTLTAEK